MAIVACDNCNIRVQSTAEGLCPSCRKPIAGVATTTQAEPQVASETTQPAIAEPFTAPRVQKEPPLPVADTDRAGVNPYRPVIDDDGPAAPVVADPRIRTIARRSWIVPFGLVALNAVILVSFPQAHRHIAAVLSMSLIVLGILTGIGMAVYAMFKAKGQKAVWVHATAGLVLNVGLALLMTVSMLPTLKIRELRREREAAAEMNEPIR